MNVLIDILTVIYCFLTISAAGTSKVYSIITLFTSFLIIFSGKKKQLFSLKNKRMLVFLIFLAFATFEVILSGKNELSFILNLYNMFFPIVLYYYYSKRENNDKLIKVIALIWIAITIRACYLYSSGQLSARYLISHVQSDIPFSGGGYGIAIGSALLASFLLDYCLWKKNGKKLFYILLILLFFYLVVLTQSTTTLIALIVGFISSALFRIFSISSFTSLNKKQLLGLVLLITICFSLLFFKSSIGNYITSSFNNKNDIVSRRIKEFGSLISGENIYGVNMEDSTGRTERMINSIRLSFKYPLFGIVSVVGMNHYSQLSIGLGGHSELFDAFARYGLFIGLMYISIYLSGIKEILKCKKNELGLGYIVTFTILFIFNPCLYTHVNIALFLVLPLFTKKNLMGDSNA